MKILFVSENYYPQTSGVPIVVKYLAEGLAIKGHHVAVATQNSGNTVKQETINGVEVFRFDLHENFFKQYKGNIRAFVNFVVKYSAEATIIECTRCITTDLLLPHISQIKGNKFFHVHGISGLTPGKKLFELKSDFKHTIGNTYNVVSSFIYYNCTLKKALPYFKATLSLSDVDYGIEYLRKYSKKNYILDNAADDTFFDNGNCMRNIIDKYVTLANKRYMISCANYTHIKNQKGIITQFYKSASSKKNSLVCIGSQETPYYHECIEINEELKKLYGPRDVHLLIGVDRNDIPAIINYGVLYLVGSTWEQYSISIIEAMSRGVPFISTNVGNARLLPGGITIDSIEEMHRAIDSLLINNTEYENLSENGRKFAFENCRKSVAVDKLEKIISDR